MRLLLLGIPTVFLLFLAADEEGTHHLPVEEKSPWFTGPIVAPSAYTVPHGHWNIEPYLYYNVYTGNYTSRWKPHSTPNFYNTTIQVQAKAGVAKWLDFQFYPQVLYNETEGRHYCNIGDMPVALNFQLFRPPPKNRWPAVKLSLRTNVPFGKYQHLKSSLKMTDAIGAGSWLPGAALVLSRLLHFHGRHYLDMRLAINYTIGTAVHVKGFNTYGGAPNTRGVVYPGNSFAADGSIQYSLTQRWAFACDLIYTHSNKNRFSGKAGSLSGSPARISSSSNEQWSLAPAIEYNWSRSVGILAGSWFTFAGRNSTRFVSGVIALNINI